MKALGNMDGEILSASAEWLAMYENWRPYDRELLSAAIQRAHTVGSSFVCLRSGPDHDPDWTLVSMQFRQQDGLVDLQGESARSVAAVCERERTHGRTLAHLVEAAPGVLFRAALFAERTISMTYVSQSSKRVLGVLPEALKTDATILFPTGIESDHVWPLIHQSARYGIVFDAEYQLNLPNGKSPLVHVRMRPEPISNGLSAFSGVLLDISDSRADSIQLRALGSNLPSVLFTMSSDARGSRSVHYASPNARELVGLNPALLCHEFEYLFSCVHPEDRSAFRNELFRLMSSREPLDLSVRMMRDDHPVQVRLLANCQCDVNEGSLWHGVILPMVAPRSAAHKPAFVPASDMVF